MSQGDGDDGDDDDDDDDDDGDDSRWWQQLVQKKMSDSSAKFVTRPTLLSVDPKPLQNWDSPPRHQKHLSPLPKGKWSGVQDPDRACEKLELVQHPMHHAPCEVDPGDTRPGWSGQRNKMSSGLGTGTSKDMLQW